MSVNFKMIAKTFYGFEDILADELLKLGAQKIIKGNRSVSFFWGQRVYVQIQYEFKDCFKNYQTD